MTSFRLSLRPRIAVAFLLLLIGLVSVAGASAADPTTVVVSATSLGSLSTQISTNDVWSGLIDSIPKAKTNFAALNLQLVRLHVGDDGSPIAMPETKQNQWSFAALNTLVNDVTSTGQRPLMNIKFAPDWQWTCTKLYTAGTVRDQTFGQFADYMARLVSYYNTGTMTTETGTVITNPAGTSNRVTYWELWNEPDLNNETPCAPSNGFGLTPAQYVTMWNAVVAKMLAVDPSLKFVGPATANGQFGSDTGAQNDYITQLMAGATVKPYAISFHGYGYWDNTVADKTIFDGDGTSSGAGGIPELVAAAQAVRTTYPAYPIWMSEVNVNADWGADVHGRPWGPLGAAWWASIYSKLAPLGVEMIHQYNVAEGPQFGLINDQTGDPFLPYWVVKTLNAGFPNGSTRLQVSSPDPQVQMLAARRPDGTISVLVVNRRLTNNTSTAGTGLPADLVVSLSGITPTSVALQQIDSTTSVAQGPPTLTLDPLKPIALHFPGYGLAMLTIGTGGAPPPPAVPVNTTLPSVAGTATVGQMLTANNGAWTNNPTSYTAPWSRCDSAGASCTPILDGSGVPVATPTYTLAAADAQHTVEIGVDATNAAGTSARSWSAPTGVVSQAPPPPVAPSVTVLPTISGSAQVGSVLTAAPGTWAGTTPIAFKYAWERCNGVGAACLPIAGATARTYTVAVTDVASTLAAVVTATNAAGSATATALPTGIVPAPVAIPPSVTVLPTISGSAQVGSVLTAAPGTWAGTTPISFTYAWQRCNGIGAACLPIAGATARTYTVAVTDVASTLAVVVTATNAAGSTTATTLPTGIVLVQTVGSGIALDKSLGQRSDNVGAASMTLSTTTAGAAATRVVLFVSWDSRAKTLVSVTGGGLTWTVDAQAMDAEYNHGAIASAFAPAGLPAGSVIKAVFSGSVTHGLIAAASFTGVASSGAVDSVGSSTQAGLTSWSSGVATTNAADLVIAWSNIDAVSTSTPAVSMTEVNDLANADYYGSATSAFHVESTPGAKTVAGTWAGNAGATANVTVVVAYKAGS